MRSCYAPVAFVSTSSWQILNFPLRHLTATNTGNFGGFVSSHAHGHNFLDRIVSQDTSFFEVCISTDFQIGCAVFSKREIHKIFVYAKVFTLPCLVFCCSACVWTFD